MAIWIIQFSNCVYSTYAGSLTSGNIYSMTQFYTKRYGNSQTSWWVPSNEKYQKSFLIDFGLFLIVWLINKLITFPYMQLSFVMSTTSLGVFDFHWVSYWIKHRNQHMSISFFEFALSTSQKRLENVVALIGDSCATKKALFRNFAFGFPGCASHRFKLAIKDLFLEHKAIIESVSGKKKILLLRLRRAALRVSTAFSPVFQTHRGGRQR